MRLIYSICVFMLIGYQADAQKGGMQFQDLEWSEALKKAKSENKLIFLNGMAQWSQPCKLMDEYTFSDTEVGEYYNKNFINLSIDMEAFPGSELAERYQVYLYPTLLFINGDGVVVHRGCGAMESAALIDLGQRALDPETRLAGLQKKYDEGNRDSEFLANMSATLSDACLDQTAWVDHFFSELNQSQWTSKAAWTMISLNVDDPYSPYFQYLMKYKDLYVMNFGKDTVDQKIYDVLLSQFTQIYEGEDIRLFAIQALKSIIQPLEFGQKDELEAMVNLQYAEEKEDWDLYCKSAILVVSQQGVEDPLQLNEFAWKIYVFSEDAEQLKTAKGWLEPLIKQYDDPSLIDTYASLIYKLGDVKSAIRWEKKAVRLAEMAEDEDLLHYQLQLERFESGL
ncbi:MAG: DUF255 domain-containing protein [Cyclobacteriaceae bacterium]|nr:DUF255 domain-containing protein [Cyclobacteriaceae bacterium SS2]